MSRWAALDGVRALAVAGVILYHAGVKWVPGGLLGVDVFFVLSGFLITSLLLREVRGGGRVNLGAFWARRARRLLPALLLVLLAVSLWAALDPAQDIRSIRFDVGASLSYVANWRFAFSHQGYFAGSQTPSPVLHLWSLGVEEQFYLLWPLLVAAVVLASRFVMRLVRRRALEPCRVSSGRVAVCVLAALGALASTGWLIYGAITGTDASRLYYGTDTRALALLAGAVLAACCPLPRSPSAVGATVRANRRWTAIGALALGSLIAIVALVGGQDRLLYRGGFLVVAVLVALLLAALVRAPRAPLSRLLGLRPMAHIGRISYGLYLWHWPVILFMTGERTGLTGAALLWARIGVSLGLAEVSYWLMERPVLGGFLPGPRLASVGLVAVVGLIGVAGPWSAVPRAGDGGSRAAFASKLDSLAKRQEEHSATLSRQRVVLPRPTPAPVTLSSNPGVARGVPAAVGQVPSDPFSMVVVGDSTAFSAALALQDRAYAWKIYLQDASRVGCGIAPGTGAGAGDQAPVRYGECWDWPQRWQQTVAVQRPAVSLMVLGHWEVVDRNVNGKVMHIGQPVYDNLLRAELEKAVSVLGSQGGKVALATAPCYQRPERADGARFPQDDCRRVQDFNKLIWAVAAAHPTNVMVLDLYQYFSPDGRWHLSIGGHQVRDHDGIHFDADAGEWLAPVFLGGIRTLLGLPAIPQAPPLIKVSATNGG